MGKFSDNIYAMNESLLDDVEIEEVQDDEQETEQTVEYKFMFNFNSGIDGIGDENTVVKNMFFDVAMSPALEKLKSQEYVAGWLFDKKPKKVATFPNIYLYSLQMQNSKTFEQVYKNTSSFLLSVNFYWKNLTPKVLDFVATQLMCSVMSCGIAKNVRMAFWKSGEDIDVTNVYIVSYDNGMWVFFSGSNGYNTLYTCTSFAGNFIRVAARTGIVKAADDKRTRYVAYCFGKDDCEFVFLFDSEGKLIMTYPVNLSTLYDNMAGDVSYDENGLMYMKFESGENYVRMDGSLLHKDNFLKCSSKFSEGYAVVKRKGDARLNLIDTNGSFLCKEWYKGCTDFMNGFSLVVMNGKHNIVDKTGNPVFNEWFDEIKFTDESSGVMMVRDNDKVNYIRMDGSLVSEEWFGLDCEPMHNGYAKVRSYETCQFNFIKEDGTLVSDEWFWIVCGWPENGMYACCIFETKEWEFRETSTNKVLFGGRKFFVVKDNKQDNCDMKFYTVTIKAPDKNNSYDFLKNLISSDGVKFSDMTGFYNIDYIGNGMVVVQDKPFDKNVLMKWNGGKVSIDRDISICHKFDREIYGGVYADIASVDQEHNVIDTNGNLFFKDWDQRCEKLSYGFALVSDIDKNRKNVVTHKGAKLFGDDGVPACKIDVIVPFELVSVSVLSDRKKLAYNLFDADGNKILDKWSEYCPVKIEDGMLRVGPDSYIDYSGKFISII